MDPGSAATPDEGWHFEWRWGTAHPWLRSSAGAAVPLVESSSSQAPSRSPVPSATPCRTSSHVPGLIGLPSKPCLSPGSPPSCGSSTQTSRPLSTSKTGDDCSQETAFSSSVHLSTPSWPPFLPILSVFYRLWGHGGPTTSPACKSSQTIAGNTRAPTAVGDATARPPAAQSLSGKCLKKTGLALENSAETALARGAVMSPGDLGTQVAARAQGCPQEATSSVTTAAECLPDCQTVIWNPTPAQLGACASSRETTAALDHGTQERDEIKCSVDSSRVSALPGGPFPAAPAATTCAAPADATLARSADSAVTHATSTAAQVHKKKILQQKGASTTNFQTGVPRLLLQFGDQTLSFLQRQQMALWSVFAFRDWRVKTLVHALSAMGEPVNLVIVNCTPPASTHPSSPSSSSSPPCSFDSSLASAASWLPSLRSSSATDTLISEAPSFISSQMTNQAYVSALESLSGNQQYYYAATVEGTATAPPVIAKSRENSRSMPPTVSNDLVHASTGAGGTTREEAPDVEVIKGSCLASAPLAIGDDVVKGGYSPLYHTIWLCGNRLWSPFELRRVLLHELVHAFDFARAHISPDDCKHVACTEIRAYNLSGQCGWWRTRAYDAEHFRTVQPLEAAASQHKQETDLSQEKGQWQQTKRNRCLMHSALNSLNQHRKCHSPRVAEEAVREVFTRCARDTWPFLAPPERDSKWRPSQMWRPEAAELFKK